MAGEGRCTVKLLLSLSLFATLLGGIRAGYSISGCRKFYADAKPTLQCIGISGDHSIYWSIIDTEDNEVRIGDCYKESNDERCYGVTNSDYKLTRPSDDKSTLKIQHNIGQKDGQKIKCSQWNNNSYAFCTLDIISYTIPICESGNITLREGEVTTLQCVGMTKSHNMYWSVYDDGGNEVRIGDCGTNLQCTGVSDSDYNITRPSGNMSELTIQGNYREKSGKTIICSQKKNQTEALCTLNVISIYSINDCGSGTITFLEDTQPTLECIGMTYEQNIYWSVNDTEDNEVRIGDCDLNNTCSPVTDSDYNLTRPVHNESVLKIKGNIRQKDGYTMTCSQRKNQTKAFCKLYFIWGPLEVSVRRKKVMNTMMLTCSVDDVNPGANFTWTGVDCDNQSRTENNTVSVCVFKPTNADYGKMVTCTATNVVDNSLNASATFRIEHDESSKAFPATAIAGGAGAVAVIIVVIIVTLVILSRRKKKAAARAQHQVLYKREQEGCVEIHTNELFGLGDTTDDNPKHANPSTKPMAAALRVPPTSSVTEPEKAANGHRGFPSSNGDVPYMTVHDAYTEATSGGVGGEDDDQYAVIADEAKSKKRHTVGPKGDVYTVVVKADKKQETSKQGFLSRAESAEMASPPQQWETSACIPPGNVYARVDKRSKGDKSAREAPKTMTKPRTTVLTESRITGGGTEPGSHFGRTGMRAAGESYENVAMSSSDQPSLTEPDVTRTADFDDEYNTLMLAETHPPEGDEPNPEYSHLGAVM